MLLFCVEKFDEYYKKYITRQINKIQLAKELNISKPTLDKLIKEHQEKENLYEFEKGSLLERRRDEISKDKEEDKYKKIHKISVEKFDEYYKKYMIRQINKTQLTKELNISRPMLDKLIKEHQENNNDKSEYKICKVGKKINIENFDEYYRRYIDKEINKTQLAKELSISRPTLDKLIKEHIENEVNTK